MKKSMLVLFMVLGMVAAMVSVSGAEESLRIVGWIESADAEKSEIVLCVIRQYTQDSSLPRGITIELDKKLFERARNIHEKQKKCGPHAQIMVFVKLEVIKGRYVGRYITPIPIDD